MCVIYQSISGITLKARGCSQVEWSEKDGDERKIFKDSEEYYKYEFPLFKSGTALFFFFFNM